MRLWPFLKLAIPLGTLVGLSIGYALTRWNRVPPAPLVLEKPSPASLAPLAPPEHGHALEGRVVDPKSAPVAEALVWLRGGNEGSFTYTDAEGGFRFDQLGPGPWQAKIVALGHEPLALELEEGPGVHVVALKKSYGPPPALAKLARAPLEGQLVLPEGFDATNFEVALLPEQPFELDSALPRRSVCDARGAFRFDELLEARYRVRVLPAWARGGSWPDLLLGVGASGEHEFVHAATNPAPLRLALALGAIEGTLLDADGTPVQGALAIVAQQDDPARVWPPLATDARGRFAIPALPAGKYELAIRAGSKRLVRALELAAGERQSLELALDPAPAGRKD